MMKRLTILGLALLALAALSAVAVSAASAEEGVLPPEAFKIKGGIAKLQTLEGALIESTALTGEGTFLIEKEKDQHATGKISFTGAKAEGFPAKTLGDAAETILANVLFLFCLVEPKTLVFGVLIQPTETVHVEVPALGILILVKGAVIGQVTKGGLAGKEFEVQLAGEKGDQKKALECEINGKKFKHSYEAGLDTKADSDASQQATATVTFAKEVKFEDS
jgi:hypothetical protein